MLTPHDVTTAGDDAETPAAEPAPEAQPTPVAAVDPRDAQIADLDAQLKDAMARLRAVSKAFQDQKAEMASFKERLEAQGKVKESRRAFEVVSGFLKPVQELRTCLKAVDDVPAGFVEGLQMIHDQFWDGLHRLGLEPVPGVGSHFDPNLHEALAAMPTEDASLDGKVLIVHLEGFQVAGRVVQAAQVVVAKYTAPPAEVEAEVIDAPAEGDDAG